MQNVHNFLKKIGIEYEIHNHPAVFTVDEAKEHRIDADFGENKNLFLRNKKGNKHFLVTLGASKRLDLKKLAENVGEKSLGFASEEKLMKYLGLTPGSVSPFGLIHDTEKRVVFMMDKDLLGKENVGFHPNINTQTIVLKTEDFKNYIKALDREIVVALLD